VVPRVANKLNERQQLELSRYVGSLLEGKGLEVSLEKGRSIELKRELLGDLTLIERFVGVEEREPSLSPGQLRATLNELAGGGFEVTEHGEVWVVSYQGRLTTFSRPKPIETPSWFWRMDSGFYEVGPQLAFELMPEGGKFSLVSVEAGGNNLQLDFLDFDGGKTRIGICPIGSENSYLSIAGSGDGRSLRIDPDFGLFEGHIIATRRFGESIVWEVRGQVGGNFIGLEELGPEGFKVAVPSTYNPFDSSLIFVSLIPRGDRLDFCLEPVSENELGGEQQLLVSLAVDTFDFQKIVKDALSRPDKLLRMARLQV
jgi:hypothetical protein